MTREMEERIVAMYFDNEDFEKNAKTTIETLGQLKSGLDLKDSAKGFEIFEKLGKTLNFEKAQKGLTKIKSTLTGMTGIFKKVFNLGPIDEAAAAVENFKNRYLNRVLGFDLAHTVANALESAFRGLTIQPVSAGWTQYQNKMDSVKTIMSSTGESIENVEVHLKSLTDYANKTIYSLSDMTSNLGKFTNNGMKLKDSVQAMQGIANAAADAGQGAQQASMAMYNFSQAMGVGKMTTIDWKSIENANMATQRLKNTFIEMAAAQGELHKEFSETDKKYHYYITKNSKGQAEKDRKKWTEVTAKNFRETLSKDWLTAEAMMHALMVYSGEALDPDTVKSWGITDPKMIEDLEKIGKDALEAATQVRTFSKMMDALKEAAQSGWADTFELIFGNMEQGTTLWTEINKVLDDIVSKSADARNNMLQIWAGSKESTKEEEEELSSKTESLQNLEEYLAKLEEESNIEGTTAKIDALRESIQKYKDQIAELKKGKTKDNAESTQAQIDRRLKKVQELEDQIKELEKRNKQNVSNQKNQAKMTELVEQINAYQAEIQALKHADEIDADYNADASAKRQKQIAEKEKKMAELQKQLDKLRETTGADEIEKTKKEIENLKKEIDQLNATIDEKNSKEKSQFVDEQGRTGREILFDRETGALFQMIDLAREFGTTFSEAFRTAFGAMDAEKLFNMTKDFGNTVKQVVEWFGKANDEGSRMSKIKKGLQGVFSILKTVVNFLKIGFNLLKKVVEPVANFIINAFEKFGIFFDGLGELKPVEVFKKLGEGLQKTWEKVKKFFTPQEIINDQGKHTGKYVTPVISWIQNVWSELKKTVRQWSDDNGLTQVYNDVSNWWTNFRTSFDAAFQEVKAWWTGSGIPAFFEDMWDGITRLFRPELVVEYGGHNGPGAVTSYYKDSPFVSFFKSIGSSIDQAFEDVEKWWNKSGIVEFFTNMWDGITGLFRGKEITGKQGYTWNEDSPFVKFFKGIGSSIDQAFTEVKNWWEGSGIPDFFSKMWNSIVGWFQPQYVEEHGGSNGPGAITSRYEDSPFVKFFKGIGSSIDQAFTEVKNWWEGSGIPDFFKDMWDAIVGWFQPTYTQKYGGSNGPGAVTSYYEDSPFVKFFKGIGSSIDKAFEGVKTWWSKSGIPEFFENMWNSIKGNFEQKLVWKYGGSNGPGAITSYYEEAPIVSWLKGVWESVRGVWDSIVGWEGWSAIGEFLSNTWGWITGLFAGSSSSVAGASEGAVAAAEEVVNAANKTKLTPEETEESLSFFQRIMETLGDFIGKVVAAVQGVVIPQEVSDFVTHVSDFLLGIIKSVGDILGSFGKWFKNGWGSEGWTSEDTWNILGTIIAGIGIFITNLLSAKWTSSLSSVNNIGTQFLMFGGGLLAIAAAISLLTTIDQNKMYDAAKVLGGLALAIGGVLYAVATVNKTVNNVQTTGVERFFTNVINKGAMLGALAIITSALPAIIGAVTEAKKAGADNIGEDILKIGEGMGIMFGSIALTMGILTAVSPKGIDPTAALKTALSVAAVAAVMVGVFEVLGGIPRLIGEITEGNQQSGVTAAIELIKNGGQIMSALGVAIGEFFGSMIGAFGGGVSEGAMISAANGISRSTEVLSKLSTDDLDKFTMMLGFVVELQKSFGNSNVLDIFDRLTTGGKLGTLGDQMPKLAEGMTGFLDKIRDFTSEDMDRMRESMRFIAYFGNAVSLVADAVLGKRINPGAITKSAVFQEYLNAAELLSEAVKKGLQNEDGSMTGLEFNAMPIIEAICKALLNGETAIARAVKDMVNAGLQQVDDGDHTSYNRLQVPDQVITKYEELIGKYKTTTGGTFNVNDMVSELMGDEGTFNQLMSQFDSKTEELNMKWEGLTDVFDHADFTKFKILDSETGEEKETDLLSYFQQELAQLSQTLDETGPLEITITPVFDMTNMTPEKLQAALDSRFMNDPLLAKVSISNPAANLDLSHLGTDLGIDRLESKLGSILLALGIADKNNATAIDELKRNMSSISDSIAGMRLVLDTGVLVGQITPMIDLELGRRSSLYGRTGVVFTRP